MNKNSKLKLKELVDSKYGVLTEAFILMAIAKEAVHIMNSKVEDYPIGSIINPKLWIEIATEIHDKLNSEEKKWKKKAY